MLNTIKKNRSLTYYQPTSLSVRGSLTSAHVGGLASASIADVTFTTATTTTGFNTQCSRYIQYCQQRQQVLLDKTSQYLQKVREAVPEPTATQLRDKGNWGAVKRLVIREEMMKLQISGKTDLPIIGREQQALLDVIKDKDLAAMSDTKMEELFNSTVKRDERAFLDALKAFKENGKTSHLLQANNLQELKKALSDVDLSKITRKQLDNLIKNYCEEIKQHHETSISFDPDKQSMADNIVPLKTSEHQNTHYNPDKGVVDYNHPVEGPEHNRTGEMAEGNRKRVFRNELQGLGIAAAIGAGIGFTIGFAVTLAQSGVSPDSLRTAMASGAKGGAESGILSAVGYGIGRTIGHTIGQTVAAAITGMLENPGVEIANNITQMCNMGAVGFITITVFSVYQFIKLKLRGTATREALLQVGKQALFSLSLLAISIAVQGLYGGHAGTIVSISIGVILVIYTIGTTAHHRKFEDRLRIYTIEKCKPVFA